MATTGAIEKAVLGAFVGDSLSLGAHWVYRADVIKNEIGTVDKLLPPRLNDYHKGKDAGDFTHYGESMLILLESLAAKKTFDVQDFRQRWQSYWKTSSSYLDHATKETLQNLENENEKGLDLNDFNPAGRQAPLLMVSENEEQLVEFAIQHCRITHENSQAIATSEFVSRVLWRIVHNHKAPSVAVQEAIDTLKDKYSEVIGFATQGFKAVEMPDEEANNSFLGTRTYNEYTLPVAIYCFIPGALPIATRLITKYESETFEKALAANFSFGGDNAARSLFIGSALGGRENFEIPSKWINGIRRIDHIRQLINSLKE